MENVGPTLSSQRILSLDLLRGIAVLGILIMNITSFSQIGIAYLNPTVGVGLEGYNFHLFNFNYIFADGKFMSIFSILFGAGVVLFGERIESKGMKAWKWHYRRMFWLLLFGLAHAYLIWMGDILVGYAICGSIVFLLRKKSFKTLWIIGTILFIIPILFTIMTYYGTPPDQLEEIFAFFNPSESEVQEHTAIMLGSFMDQTPLRIQGAIELQTIVFAIEQFWKILALMILGMILFRKGILSGERQTSFYKKMMLYGLTSGVAISAVGLYLAHDSVWNGAYMMNIGSMYNYVGSLLTALGYIGAIVLFYKSGLIKSFQSRLRAVGRMAFTNYILMSIICTLIFNGHGLGYFGQVDRLGMWLVVLINWIVILMISPIILERFRYGPLEWIWRKLTYWNLN